MPIDRQTEQISPCKRCGAPIRSDAPLGQCPKCLLNVALGHSAVPPDDGTKDESPSKVRLFGDYELLELIARGGMGLVYRARQISLNRIVALKMISTGDLASPVAVERFHTEAEAAARLEHPNIVPIYDIKVHEDQHFFTMRFLEGGTLTEAMEHERLSSARAVDLVITIARAVHYAHRFGILHRDIKPGNILFDAEGKPFVADFSLAKMLGSESGLTRSSAALGTPSYMAPEQITGNKQLSTAADVYGLGAVLYELLTGRPPFGAATPLETMRLALEREPQRLRHLNPAVPRDLEMICLKCLEKDPFRRYGSAEDLAEDLDAWQSHRPLKARPVSTAERVIKWGRRKPAIAGLVVALHVIALAGLIGIIWQARRASVHAGSAIAEAERANREAARARTEFQRAEEELWRAQFSEARAVRIAGGDGARVRSRALLETLVTRPDLDESQRIILRNEAIAQFALTDLETSTNRVSKPEWQPLGWSRNLDRYLKLGSSNALHLHEFPSHKIVASFPAPPAIALDHAVMSPDERFVAALYRNGQIQVWRTEDSSSIAQAKISSGGYPQGPSFSEDGRLLMISSVDGLEVYPLEPVLPPKHLKAAPITMARFSPDSRTIAAVVEGHAIEILDIRTGEVLVHHRPDFPPERLAWHPEGTKVAVGGDRGKLAINSIEETADGRLAMRQLMNLSGHQNYVMYISFSPDGKYLFSSGWDFHSIIWDLRSGTPLLRFPNIAVSTFHPSGEELAIYHEAEGTESVARFYQAAAGRTLFLDSASREPLGVWIDPNDQLALISYDSPEYRQEGVCVLWRISDGAHLGEVAGIWAQFAPDSRSIIVFEREGNIAYRYPLNAHSRITDSDRVLVYQGIPGERVNTGKLLSDGRTLVIAATRALIFLDLLGQREPRRWEIGAHVVDSSPEGRYIATMLQNDPCRVWDVQTQQVVFTGPTFSEIVFSPDSRHFSVSTQHEIQVRKTVNQELSFPPIKIDASNIRPELDFSKDGKFFAALLDRRYVRLYETATGRVLADLTPLSREPHLRKIRFNPDSSWLLVTGSNRQTIGWNLPIVRRELGKLGLDWELSTKPGL